MNKKSKLTQRQQQALRNRRAKAALRRERQEEKILKSLRGLFKEKKPTIHY